MKKKQRGALHKKQRVHVHPPHTRAPRVYRKDFATLRAEAMDGVLTPAEMAVWDRTHRHD